MKITLTLNITRGKKPEQPEPEPQPEGNNFTQAELLGESDRNHALNNNDRPGHYGHGISLKWHGE